MKRTEPKSAEESEKRSDFERFEDLTRKLVRVPKKEIDAERTKENGSSPKE
jgi:hypothetical protein